jgi:hypothetical protein
MDSYLKTKMIIRTMEDYIEFFNKFNALDEYKKHIPIIPYMTSLFGIAYLKSSEYANMNLIPSSLKMFKYMSICYVPSTIVFGTSIIRCKIQNGSYILCGGDPIFTQPIYKDVHIPSSIEFVITTYPIEIPPTVKYLTIHYVNIPYRINTELEYLYVYNIKTDRFSTAKNIKFLTCSLCISCIGKLSNILLHVKYLIFNQYPCDCSKGRVIKGGLLYMLLVSCINKHFNCVILGIQPKFKEMNEILDVEDNIEFIKYLF